MRSILTFILALVSLPVWAVSPVCLQGVQYNPLRTEGASVQLWVRPGDPRNTLNGQGISQLTDLSGLGHHLVQSTAANQPQITRSDNKGNLIVQSEAFHNVWSLNKIALFGGNDTGEASAGSFANTSRTTDPLGGYTADFIQELDQTGGHAIQQNITLPNGDFVFSVWVKAAGRTSAALFLSGPNVGKSFSLTGGGSIVGDVVGAPYGASISAAGNGWYLCSITCRLASAYTASVQIYTFNGATVNYLGDNTSGLFLWGVSLRPASWDPDYIATTTLPAYAGARGQRLAYFDGVNDYLKTAAFTLNQPETIVGVFRQWTWTDDRILFDGFTPGVGQLYQRGATPNLRLYAGGSVADNTNLAVGRLGAVQVIFNGNASSLRIDDTAPTIGPAGVSSMGGFTMGSSGGNVKFANIQTGEIVVFQGALSDAWQQYNIQGQARLYGINIY